MSLKNVLTCSSVVTPRPLKQGLELHRSILFSKQHPQIGTTSFAFNLGSTFSSSCSQCQQEACEDELQLWYSISWDITHVSSSRQETFCLAAAPRPPPQTAQCPLPNALLALQYFTCYAPQKRHLCNSSVKIFILSVSFALHIINTVVETPAACCQIQGFAV